MSFALTPPRTARSQPGYALLVVLVTLAVAAFVVSDLARRVGEGRSAVLGLQQQVQARVAVSDAMQMVGFWLASGSPGPLGYGSTGELLAMDGRPYAMPGGVALQAQDLRGLMSLNIPDRLAMQSLLVNMGLQPLVADAWVDVLLDYTDADSLRRLNGAEARDYEALGLQPPRDDWLRTPAEVYGMPAWRDAPEVVARALAHASARRSNWINPNTATLEVLRAYLPGRSPEQLARFMDLRKTAPFATAAQVAAATGLDFSAEPFQMWVGPEVQVTLWAPGLPHALQYTITVLRASTDGPWLVTEHSRVARPSPPTGDTQLATFPLDLALPDSIGDAAPRRP